MPASEKALVFESMQTVAVLFFLDSSDPSHFAQVGCLPLLWSNM